MCKKINTIHLKKQVQYNVQIYIKCIICWLKQQNSASSCNSHRSTHKVLFVILQVGLWVNPSSVYSDNPKNHYFIRLPSHTGQHFGNLLFADLASFFAHGYSTKACQSVTSAKKPNIQYHFMEVRKGSPDQYILHS